MKDPNEGFIEGEDPWTYFGLFSANQMSRIERFLNSEGVEFYQVKTIENEERLKAWGAWDVSSCESGEGHELFIHDRFVEKVGTSLVEMFACRDQTKSADASN